MGAVWMRARAELRARWRAWVALALIAGVFGGAVIALAAAARRTDSAYDRFLVDTRAADVWVPNLPFGSIWAQFDFDELAAHPLVAESGRVAFTFVDDGPTDDLGIIAPMDDGVFRRFNIARVIEGRLPDPESPDEISLPFTLADELGSTVGDRVRWRFPGADGAGFTHPFTVVGIYAAAGDFPPVGNALNAMAAPAFFERYGATLFRFDALVVRLLDGGAGEAAFSEALNERAEGKVVFTISNEEQAGDVRRSIDLQVAALWASAIVAGLSVLLVVGQAIARQSFVDMHEDPVLRSLGMARRNLFGVGLVRGAMLAGGASLVATGTAFALSGLAPRGVAAVAEPSPGPMFDAVAIGSGVAVLVMCILSITVTAGVRRSHRPVLVAARTRPSLSARALSASAAPPTMLSGVRFALEPGRGHAAPPVRTTITSVAAGLAALAAVMTFAASMDRMLATPALYGVMWDRTFTTEQGENEFFSDARTIAGALADEPGIAAVTLISQGVPTTIDGVPVPGLEFAHVKGAVTPHLLSGRLPAGDDEIVVGATVLPRIGKRLGDEVALGIQGSNDVPATIVGTAVLPPMGTNARFGGGVYMPEKLLLALAERSPAFADLVPPPDEAAVIFEPGVDRTALIERLLDEVPGLQAGYHGIDAADIVSFGRVRSAPIVLAALLGALALAALVHGLVSAVLRRREELAILRTLGFVGAQLRTTVAWQAVALATVTLAIGIPLGIVAGRVGWLTFAGQAGIVGRPAVSASIVLVAPAALVIALIAAAFPARRAARARPAEVFRA